MKHLCLFLVCFLSGIGLLLAQSSEGASFELKLSYDTIGIDETLTLNYTLNNTKLLGQFFTPPNFEQAQLIAGPRVCQSMSSINGHVTSQNTYSYVIKPQQLGLLFLPAMAIKTEAGWLELQEQTVVVIAETPNRPQSPNPMVQRSPFDHPYFQQQEMNPYQDIEQLQDMRRSLPRLDLSPLEFQFEMPDGQANPMPKKQKKERKTYRI